MKIVLIPTPTTGRILIEDAVDGSSSHLVVGCHGYGQDAEQMLEELRRIPGHERWRRASVQGLHRFYRRQDDGVVASWMTRQDRDAAIADNVEYMNRAVEAAGGGGASAIVFVGFSQGASMAARAAVNGRHRAAGLIVMGGDIPADARATTTGWPPVMLGVGSKDAWYGARVESDVKFLEAHGIRHDVVRFEGGHEFTDEFRARAGAWLETVR